ncbi:MAG TPA: hypothetical protein VK760_03760 [Candidatus Acidoferrales bacterium]|jgi:hypothetical protein|nr:hypothetical protein [Candidatus Acidoferrales bacterium]
MKKACAILALAALASCRGSATDGSIPGAGAGVAGAGRVPHAVNTAFKASGRSILLDGKPFLVKGVAYSPTPIGTTVGDLPLLDDPLRNANKPIWSRDLPRMVAMGVNAIHVYNVAPPGYDQQTGPIAQFLNAAWNGGKTPVYVLMSVYFTGDQLLNATQTQLLAKKYHDLDQKYAAFPAVMGVAIGNEIGTPQYYTSPAWWKNFNIVADAARKGFADGGAPNKLVTTSEADYDLQAVQNGEKYNAAVDVWGVNIYRGRTFTSLFTQIRSFTKKPVMLTEYGMSAARHTKLTNTYSFVDTPAGLGVCKPDTPSGVQATNDVVQLPATGNPNMNGLVNAASNNATSLYTGYKADKGVSGGFYFEWNDEWWKGNASTPSVHSGTIAFRNYYPSCNEDQGWYGLNAVSKGQGTLDTLAPRPTLAAIKKIWASEKP